MRQILDHRGNPIQRSADRGARDLRGRYDAAQLTEENRRHWSQADNLSARAANSPDVRRRLRDRCRYEVANNSWASGVADALADFMIGTGPRLQVLTEDREFNQLVESEWREWSEAVGLADKLWLLRRVRAVDGEGFLFLSTDDGLDPITLDLQEYEAEQIATPYALGLNPLGVDGIELSRVRKPAYYHLLDEHPGDNLGLGPFGGYQRIPAAQVIHWFRATRPGQYRGVPEFTQSIPLFANLRRYRDATIAAAETAADFAAVLYSDLPPDSDALEGDPFETTKIERRMMTTLPAGWKMGQFKAEQPATGHPEFVRTCLTELATGHGTTYEVASGDYSNVNYSSGKLGHQRFQRAIEVDRARMEKSCLNRILRAWLVEAVMVRLVPDLTSRADGWAHRWLWPGVESIDPVKDATAAETRLRTFTTTFSEECYREGIDPETRVEEIARDVEMFAEHGLPSPYGQPAPAPAQSPDPSTDGASTDGTPPDAPRNGRAAGQALVHRNGRL